MPIVQPQVHLIIILIGIIIAIGGIGIAIFGKGPKKMQNHLMIESIGFLFILIGIILGMFISILHAYIGLLAIFLLVIGVSGGLYYKSIKPTAENKDLIVKKKEMRHYHILGGRTTTIMLLLTLVLGILTNSGLIQV